MLDLAFIVALQALLLAAVIILREPKLLVPCVILGLPVEYLQTQALDVLGQSGVGGAIRTMLNPGKAAMAATIVMAAWRCRHDPARLIPNSSFLIPVVVFAGVITLGVGWSDTQRPPNAVLNLPLYVAFVFAAPTLIENRRDIERIVAAFFIAAALLSLIAMAQRILGVFQWRAILIESDDYSYRSNATFADPNNLARFLVITMALAIGAILATGPRRMTVYLAAPALVLSLPALILTASRSGWLGFVLASSLMILVSPIAGATRLRLLAGGALGVAVLLGLLALQGGPEFERVRTLTLGTQVLGQREFLIRAGWEMWKDNPFIGVGTGSYQNSLIHNYLWVIPWWAKTTLSHTSFVSLMAEGGIVAIAMFGFVVVRVANASWAVYRREVEPYARLLAAFCAVALIEILFQSQSEGRLYEEPYLYAIFALFIAIEQGAARRRRTTAAGHERAGAGTRMDASLRATATPAEPSPGIPPAPA